MILKSDIEKSYTAQRKLVESPIKQEIQRSYLENINWDRPQVEVITGIRRCGKSTLLKHIIQGHFENTAYFNFEDSRIYGFEVSDFTKLDEVMGEEVEAYFFDEIQNVAEWEIFIRQLHERGEKVFLTGSNASLLSKELGTKLTGRYIKHELFPFSFDEFLKYEKRPNSTEFLDYYIKNGGFPEFLQTGQIDVLQQLFKDIVLRDIAVRNGVRNTKTLMDLGLYLMSNIGKEHSFNSLRKAFEVGSVNTIIDYYSWMEDAYLILSLPRFSWSAKKQNVNPRKVYAIDTGLARANSLSFTEDQGRLLENAVFLHLRRKTSSLFYLRQEKECDFLVFEQRKCKMAIQVCQEIHQDNLTREVAGLKEAIKLFDLKEGYIITSSQEDRLEIEGAAIKIIPANTFFQEFS